MIEDPILPEHRERADAEARATLVHSASVAALAALRCRSPEKFSPLIEDQFKAILVSEDVGLRVFAIDPTTGEVRTGPTGPMTPLDVAARLRDEIPEIFLSHKNS